MNTKNIMARAACTAILALALCLPARAQFNQFSEPISVSLGTPVLLSGGAQVTTNQWVDTHGMAGIATVTFFNVRNSGSGTMTATLEASSDASNPVAFGNYALATSTAVIYTNLYYGTNGLTATNTYQMPGTIVTPTASTAGWATPYLFPAPFTNSGAVTISASGIYQIAYNVADAPRYVRVIFAPGGSATNSSVAAVLRARKVNYP